MTPGSKANGISSLRWAAWWCTPGTWSVPARLCCLYGKLEHDRTFSNLEHVRQLPRHIHTYNYVDKASS